MRIENTFQREAVKPFSSARIQTLFRIYSPILDSWRLYDGSRPPPGLIAHEEQRLLSIHDVPLYQRIQHQAEVSAEQST